MLFIRYVNAMHKSLIALAAALTFLSTGSVAFAYELPAPVSTDSVYVGGEGEVDLSRPSSIEATLSTDNTYDESIWATAGDVAGGFNGYGFFLKEDMLYLVSHNDSSMWMIPLQFVHKGAPVHVVAHYTPFEGIRVDSSSVDGSWSEYARAILTDYLPNGAFHNLGAFNVSVTSRFSASVLRVGEWKYAQ